MMNSPSHGRWIFVDTFDPITPRKRRAARQIRSHAISTALAHRRRQSELRGEHFRGPSAHTPVDSSQAYLAAKSGVPSGYLGLASVDPFESLSIDARRLTTLMHLKSSLRAGEPVVNINDAIHFQTLHKVFEMGLTDGALTAALGLTMAYAASAGGMDDECSKFNLIACRNLRRVLQDESGAPRPATFGAVLLLLGVEVRCYVLRGGLLRGTYLCTN